MTSSQALTTFNADDFGAGVPALRQDIGMALEAVRVNLRGRRLNPRDLEKIRIPTGGSTTWMVPTLGGTTPVQSLDGVIVGVGTPRVYWAEAYGQGAQGQPPACKSDDGITGQGLYGMGGELAREGGRRNGAEGTCDRCPMNQWPARGEANRKKPCSELRNLFFFPAGELGEGLVLPMVIIVTPGSLKATDDFLVRLSGRGLPYYGAAVRLELVQARNAGGLAYAQVKYSALGRLSAEDYARARAFADGLAPLFGQVDITREDVHGYQQEVI